MTVEDMLERRIGLRDGEVLIVWSGYSRAIGNVAFKLPDVFAAAAEIGRRSLAEKDWRLRVRAIRRDGLPTANDRPLVGSGWTALPFCPIFPLFQK